MNPNYMNYSPGNRHPSYYKNHPPNYGQNIACNDMYQSHCPTDNTHQLNDMNFISPDPLYYHSNYNKNLILNKGQIHGRACYNFNGVTFKDPSYISCSYYDHQYKYGITNVTNNGPHVKTSDFPNHINSSQAFQPPVVGAPPPPPSAYAFAEKKGFMPAKAPPPPHHPSSVPNPNAQDAAAYSQYMCGRGYDTNQFQVAQNSYNYSRNCTEGSRWNNMEEYQNNRKLEHHYVTHTQNSMKNNSMEGYETNYYNFSNYTNVYQARSSKSMHPVNTISVPENMYNNKTMWPTTMQYPYAPIAQRRNVMPNGGYDCINYCGSNNPNLNINENAFNQMKAPSVCQDYKKYAPVTVAPTAVTTNGVYDNYNYQKDYITSYKHPEPNEVIDLNPMEKNICEDLEYNKTQKLYGLTESFSNQHETYKHDNPPPQSSVVNRTTSKSQNLREFLSSWNEDDDDGGTERSDNLLVTESTGSVHSGVLEGVNELDEDGRTVTTNHLQFRGLFTSYPKIHVGITVDGNIATDQFINLPDIIIDIEKSKERENLSDDSKKVVNAKKTNSTDAEAELPFNNDTQKADDNKMEQPQSDVVVADVRQAPKKSSQDNDLIKSKKHECKVIRKGSKRELVKNRKCCRRTLLLRKLAKRKKIIEEPKFNPKSLLQCCIASINSEKFRSYYGQLNEMKTKKRIVPKLSEFCESALRDEHFLINLDAEEIYSNIFLVQCDINENVLEQQEYTSSNELVEILTGDDYNGEEITPATPPQLQSSTSSVVVGESESSKVFCDYDESHIDSNISLVHHEEIVPENYKKFKKHQLLLHLQNKYVQRRNFLRNFIVGRILKKYKKLIKKKMSHMKRKKLSNAKKGEAGNGSL